MYHFIEDKEFLKKLRSICSDLINQLVMAINNEGEMDVRAYLVGSGARNLETQNANQPVDLDYNLEIVDSVSFDINDGRSIKQYVTKKFNEILSKNGWGDWQDSTSCLTTEHRVFKEGNKTPFSIDLAIVCGDERQWFRLIHKKTGFVDGDQWYWNQVPNSSKLAKKANSLKANNLWNEVRETYLKKKNMYLQRGDQGHPSFICYIEAVNEVYAKS